MVDVETDEFACSETRVVEERDGGPDGLLSVGWSDRHAGVSVGVVPSATSVSFHQQPRPARVVPYYPVWNEISVPHSEGRLTTRV